MYAHICMLHVSNTSLHILTHTLHQEHTLALSHTHSHPWSGSGCPAHSAWILHPGTHSASKHYGWFLHWSLSLQQLGPPKQLYSPWSWCHPQQPWQIGPDGPIHLQMDCSGHWYWPNLVPIHHCREFANMVGWRFLCHCTRSPGRRWGIMR